jgi:hypothetical protein
MSTDENKAANRKVRLQACQALLELLSDSPEPESRSRSLYCRMVLTRTGIPASLENAPGLLSGGEEESAGKFPFLFLG